MNAPKGVVAAGHSLTVDAAEQVLRAGGNAYDGAIAAMVTACVTEPVLASLGGGGFLLACPADGPSSVFDFFVNTPGQRRPRSELDFYAIMADFGTAQQEFHIGRGTVAVPGFVRGVFDVHRTLASIPMHELVAPAVALARGGVTITDFQDYLFQVVDATFTATDAVLKIYGGEAEDGHPVRSGQTLCQPELADCIDVLAHEGDRLFYEGEIAASLDADLRSGGQFGATDLKAYRVERRQPLAVDYGDALVLTNPAPSSGGLLVGFGLKLLAGQGLMKRGFGSEDHLATLVQSMAHTAEARVAAAAMTDGHPSRVMLEPAFLKQYGEGVSNRPVSRRGTTHISIIDGQDNLACVTVSNGEGSGYVIPGTGIVMNNMLGEQDLNPDGFNRWPLGERMSSMMAPTAVEWRNGRRLATGSGGSNRIRTALLQVLLNAIEFDLPVHIAVSSPRLHFEDDLLNIEPGFAPAVLDELLEQYPNHTVWEKTNMFFGGAHTASVHGKDFQGTGDTRRGGAAVIL